MNMRQACAVAAAVFGAAAWGAVITDKTGYVWLTATEENSQSSTSWNSAGKWSDNAAPSGDKDYLVQAPGGFEECFSGTTFQMRTLMDKSGEQPFAGRSLTLDDGALNLKGNTGASYPVTLVAYGCRIAHGYGGKEYILKGSLEVHGTPETPTCLTGSACSGNRVLRVQSVLSGEPGTLVYVTRTLPDEPDGRTYAYRCLFESANPLYKGAFKVDRGNSTQAQAMYEVGFMVPGALGAPVAGGAKLTAENVLVHCGGAAFTNGYAVAVTGNITFNAAGGADGVCGACEPVPAPGGVSAFFGEGGSLTGDGATAVKLQGHEGTFVFDDVALAGVASIESKPLTTVAVLPNFQPGAVPLTVAGALTGDNSSLGAVTLNAGGHLAPGVGLDGAASVGSLTMASLTMKAGTYLLYSVQDPDGTAALFNDRFTFNHR